MQKVDEFKIFRSVPHMLNTDCVTLCRRTASRVTSCCAVRLVQELALKTHNYVLLKNYKCFKNPEVKKKMAGNLTYVLTDYVGGKFRRLRDTVY